MRLSDRAIEFPRLVLLGTVVMCALGVTAVLTLPKERTPRIRLPVILVTVPNAGAAPSTNEKQIIDKIEDEIDSSLDHLREDSSVLSQAVNGAAIVQFMFDENIEVDDAKRDVESMINRIKVQFPPEAQRDPGPTVQDIAFEDWPIIQVFVAGGRDGWHRKRIADQLETLVEKVPGVSTVDIFGGYEREVQVELNPNLMAIYGFNYRQVNEAIQRSNMDTPSGSIETGAGDDQRVRTRAKLTSLDEMREVPLGSREGKPIILADIAEVRMGHKPLKSLARYGGRDAAVLLVRAKTDIDVLATSQGVQEVVDRFVAAYPEDSGVEIGTVRSQAREIGWMLDQLLTSAVYGMILVVLILWVAMGWRNASLISLSVPLAILGSAGIMWFTKKTITPDLAINNMTLFAMILVVGMVVDGCIIVGENIYRHRELGRSPVDAAKRGIAEVGGPLVSAYLTTFAAFIPMLMVGGVMGDFMELLPIVVLFALCSAMLVDHFLMPVLSVYLMRVPEKLLVKARERQKHQEHLSPEEIEIQEVESLADDGALRRIYGGMLRYALSHRLLVMGLSLVMVATPVALFRLGAIGMEFFPDSDLAAIEVHFELPLGAAMESRTAEVAGKIEATVLRAVRSEEWYRPSQASGPVRPVTTIGEPGALSTRIDNDRGTGPEFGMVYVELSLAEQRDRTVTQIKQAIRDELPVLPGVVVQVTSPRDGPPIGAPVLLRVLGRDEEDTSIEELAHYADRIREQLKSIPGVHNISSDYRLRPEVSVTPNRMVASLFDMTTSQISTSVNYALDGVRVGEVDFGSTEDIDIRLRNKAGDRDQVEDLSNLLLRSPSDKIVSLSQVADVQRTRSANVIKHYDQQRVVRISAELHEGVLADTVKARLIQALQPDLNRSEQDHLLRQGTTHPIFSDDRVQIEFGGENQYRDDAFQDLHLALLVAIGAMLIVMTIKFNSFIQPLIVLFSVPLSLVGVSIGLMICGLNFSVAAMIGVVALAGIVVNDAIVLVDFINRLHHAGVPMERAVVYAGQLRLRPIILTTITTIGGLLPLGLNLAGGGEFFQPLTVSIMFGLGFATLLQLFIIPLCCYTFNFRSTWPDRGGEDKPAAEPQPVTATA